MSQPLLSIGMIVKNEERSLEKCLKALTPLRQAIPCELVIADTGSTDKTKEIASKYADILFDFKWINDFSKARNAVMDKCSGKWFMTVDADEYLCSPVDELVSFLNGPSADKKRFASFIQRNHGDVSMNGPFTDFNATRMVRMDTGSRYEGTIHETFNISNFNDIQILQNTIFDHDGYTQITAQHLKEKELRNLTLLENQLTDSPDNVRNILLCLEATVLNDEKRRFFTDYAFKNLPRIIEENSSDVELFGPACIAAALSYAVDDANPDFFEKAEWALKVFPNEYHSLIDINFYIAKYYYNKKHYTFCEKHCKNYLKEVNSFIKNNGATTPAVFAAPLKCIEIKHKAEIIAYLINSLTNLDKFNEIEKYISQLDLSEAEIDTFSALAASLTDKKTPQKLVSKITNAFNIFFGDFKSNKIRSKSVYDDSISAITKVFFSQANSEYCYNNFSEINGTIGFSAKLINAKTKAEAEKLLGKIENFEEFMPLALKQALLLKCEFPKEFYTISSQRLNLIINDITNATEEIADVIVNYYCNEENLKTFPQISFVFNLLLTTLFSNNIALKNELKSTLTNKFVFVAERYMTECYNENLLKNTEYINCIPNLHLFSWLLVNAFKEKDKDPLGYIKALKEIIQKIPQAKQIVEFLIEEFKNEEELKRQEKIKTASPELLAMAEQLKTMLKVFPENSPELLAIKQSPVYKQVAFLIEE
ncbi:MAG: glycosyltransferase [Ruminococcaceae bacterium]|nr:glycosyltransferase [Oscillospiraceae bacterium]